MLERLHPANAARSGFEAPSLRRLHLPRWLSRTPVVAIIRRALLWSTLMIGGTSSGHVLYEDVAADLIWLEALVRRDPVLDARNAIASGNLRFLGVAGDVVQVPGVEGPASGGCVASLEAVEVVRGTSGAVSSARHTRLKEAGTRYAARYNEIVAAHRGFKLPARCAP